MILKIKAICKRCKKEDTQLLEVKIIKDFRWVRYWCEDCACALLPISIEEDKSEVKVESLSLRTGTNNLDF